MRARATRGQKTLARLVKHAPDVLEAYARAAAAMRAEHMSEHGGHQHTHAVVEGVDLSLSIGSDTTPGAAGYWSRVTITTQTLRLFVGGVWGPCVTQWPGAIAAEDERFGQFLLARDWVEVGRDYFGTLIVAPPESDYRRAIARIYVTWIEGGTGHEPHCAL